MPVKGSACSRHDLPRVIPPGFGCDALSNWQTVHIFLGDEWTRRLPTRVFTFTSGERGRTMTAIQFEGPDSFSCQLTDDPRRRRLDFSTAVAR